MIKARSSQAAASATADAETYAKSARLGKLADRVGTATLWFVLVFGAVMFMLPLYVMVALSLKTKAEIADTSMWAWQA